MFQNIQKNNIYARILCRVSDRSMRTGTFTKEKKVKKKGKDKKKKSILTR